MASGRRGLYRGTVSDPALLALVIDDPLAPKVLAWWKAMGPTVKHMGASVEAIAESLRAPPRQVRSTLDRCNLAGLLIDGGISDVANQWITAVVGRRLGMRPKPARTKPAS